MNKKNQLYLLSSVLFFFLTLYCYFNMPIGYSLTDSVRISLHRTIYSSKKGEGVFNKVELIIPDEGMRRLEKSRVQAIKRGCMLDEFQKKIKGVLIYNGEEFPVKIKLKGTLPSHWIEPLEWSFRVASTKNIPVFEDLRIFSLQSRNQRGVYADYYYHKVLKHYDVMSLKYKYIEFYLNGMHLKNYTVEEFFDVPIIIRNNRKNGIIFKFSSDKFWELGAGINQNLGFELYEEMYKTASLKIYNDKYQKIFDRKGDSLKIDFLIKGFRQKSLLSSEVFDVTVWGKYFAINTMFANHHPGRLTNLRFFYNEDTKLIEPIGYDLEHINDLEYIEPYTDNFWIHKDDEQTSSFYRQIFDDSLMFSAYENALSVLVYSEEIDSLLKSLEKETDLLISSEKDSVESRYYLQKNLNFISKILKKGIKR